MARYRRSIPDPTGQMNRNGYVRRVRRPAGTNAKSQKATHTHREKPREFLNERLAREADPMRRIELALGYLRSAVTKYETRLDLLERVERTLIRCGDQYFAGRRLPASRIADNRRP